jgi:hypothetical protein
MVSILRKILRGRDRLWTGMNSLNSKIYARLGKTIPRSVYYIVPEADWVTDWVGRYISQELQRQYHHRMHLTSAPESLSGQIIHYGEVGAFLNTIGKPCNRENTIISTIFHGVRDNKFPELTLQTEKFLQNAHTCADRHCLHDHARSSSGMEYSQRKNYPNTFGN